jgi:hypothetical protein
MATPRVLGLQEKEQSQYRRKRRKKEGKDAPVVLLRLGLVESATSLEHGLVNTSTTSNDTNGSAGNGSNRLLGSRGETDAGAASVGVVSDDGSVVAGSTGERTTVTDLLLDVADDGSLRELAEGEDVADSEGGLLAAEDEGTGGEALGSDEGLGAHLVAVGVTEDDAGKGSATAKRGREGTNAPSVTAS